MRPASGVAPQPSNGTRCAGQPPKVRSHEPVRNSLTLAERAFDTREVLTVHDIEGYRRSAAMAPLSPDAVQRILGDVEQLARERQQIAAILAELPASFGVPSARPSTSYNTSSWTEVGCGRPGPDPPCGK